ncbi:MAG: hypothetical protein Q8Q33_02290 [Chlamydiota bacterium]|nr:hypothetical protein [Chlamydiota bacterium]
MEMLERILSALGLEGVVEKLSSSNLTWRDLHTLLLHVFENRIHGVDPTDIMRNYKENRFSMVAEANPKELVEIDRMLYGILPSHFSAIELSPVNPIGANAALTSLDPKVVLSTIRNLEVLGDPSMALSIECAKRRELLRTTKKDTETHLAASHRVLRLQAFPKDSGLTAHFRAFALASAARDTAGFNKFELSSISVHLVTWLDFLISGSNLGYKVHNMSVAISDIRIMEKLIADGRINKDEVIRKTKDRGFKPFREYSINLPEEVDNGQDIPITYPGLETYINELRFTEKQIVEPLRSKYPNVRFYFLLDRCSGLGYYSGICYRVSAENADGGTYSLAGGGACDWTRKLLHSKREHLVVSGFGTEFFNKLFKSK